MTFSCSAWSSAPFIVGYWGGLISLHTTAMVYPQFTSSATLMKHRWLYSQIVTITKYATSSISIIFHSLLSECSFPLSNTPTSTRHSTLPALPFSFQVKKKIFRLIVSELIMKDRWIVDTWGPAETPHGPRSTLADRKWGRFPPIGLSEVISISSGVDL